MTIDDMTRILSRDGVHALMNALVFSGNPALRALGIAMDEAVEEAIESAVDAATKD